MQTPAETREFRTISARIPVEMHAGLAAVAALEERSMSAVIRHVLLRRIAETAGNQPTETTER